MTNKEMKVVSFINQKGGSGKTTSAVSIAGCLAKNGHNTLFVDLDPEAHGSFHTLDIPMASYLTPSLTASSVDIGHVLLEGKNLKNAITKTKYSGQMHVVPSSSRLAIAEYRRGSIGGTAILKLTTELDRLKETGQYKYVICDCPPNLGFFTQSALLASDKIVIPTQLERLSVNGVHLLMTEIIPDVVGNLNTDLKVAGILPNIDTKMELRRDEAKSLMKELVANYGGLVFDCAQTDPIRMDAKITEAADAHKPICFYDGNSNGAQDYEKVTAEFIQRVG